MKCPTPIRARSVLLVAQWWQWYTCAFVLNWAPVSSIPRSSTFGSQTPDPGIFDGDFVQETSNWSGCNHSQSRTWPSTGVKGGPPISELQGHGNYSGPADGVWIWQAYLYFAPTHQNHSINKHTEYRIWPLMIDWNTLSLHLKVAMGIWLLLEYYRFSAYLPVQPPRFLQVRLPGPTSGNRQCSCHKLAWSPPSFLPLLFLSPPWTLLA